MADDDLDLDLEPEADAPKPKKRGLFGRSKKDPEAAKAPVADDASTPAEPGEAKPSFLSRFAAKGATGTTKASPWCIRNFVIGLIAAIVLLLVIENWASARLNFIGLHVDIPKSVLLIVDFALGFGIAWWILRRRNTDQPSE